MSLLIANGHSGARRYPVGMVYVEASFVVERLNREEANRAIMIQLAVASVISKKGSKAFQKRITDLTS